jgi:gliding motility-associated-like protein
VVTNVSCSGQLGSINGITLNGGMSPVQVSWNSNPQLNTLDISNLNVGTYVLVVNDAQGCTDTDTIVLLPPVAPVIDSTNVQILMPTCLQMGYITGLTVTGSQLTYSWTNSNETSLTIDSILPGMTYMLTVTNAYNCSDTYGPIVFNNLPSVNANFSGPEFTSLGESVTFTSNSTGVPNLSYDWFVYNAFWLGTSVTANYQADSLGVHEVILIVTDGNGCQDTIIKTIEVVTDMVIPNVFTPNNDSENDVFLIKNIPPKTELFVLDRWGLIVYSSSEYNNDWKGLSSQGLELTEGVYFYKVIPPVGSPMEGFFHLIR